MNALTVRKKSKTVLCAVVGTASVLCVETVLSAAVGTASVLCVETVLFAAVGTASVLCVETVLCAAVGTASHRHVSEACTVYGDRTVCSCRHSKSSTCVRSMYCVWRPYCVQL